MSKEDELVLLGDRSQPDNGFTVPAESKGSKNFRFSSTILLLVFAISLCASLENVIQQRNKFFPVYDVPQLVLSSQNTDWK